MATANGVRGEVAFEAQDARWVLVLDFNALCALETALDAPIAELGARLQTGRLATVRTVFHAGLHARHPELTEADAGRLIEAVGAARAGELIGEAFAASSLAAGAEGRQVPGPRKAAKRAGTG